MNDRAENSAIQAEKRTVIGKQVKSLRREGWLPATIYGHGFEPVPLQLNAHDTTPLLSGIGRSQLVDVHIAGEASPEVALVRDVQRDPITGSLVHVDFYRVSMTERIRAQVPILLGGESPVVQSNEGIAIQGIGAIEVECLPGDLVDAFEVDMSTLTEVDQALTVGDLQIPDGVQILTPADELIVRISPAYEMAVGEEEEEEEIALEYGEVEVTPGEAEEAPEVTQDTDEE